jgi:hypothetical protein
VAKPDPLSKSALKSAAQQLGELLAEAAAPAERALAPLANPKLAESLAVCFAGADQVKNPPKDLSVLANPSGIWHHQIRTSAGVTHLARSNQEGFQPDALDVQQVVESPIAEKIDRAIAWIDREIPDDSVTVRLLVIPAYYVHGLLLVEKNKYSAVLADQPQSYEGLQYEKRYPLRDFLKRLAKERMSGSLN